MVHSSSSRGRLISPYYEVGAAYGVSKERAEGALQVAQYVLGKYSCKVNFETIKGARIPTEQNPLKIRSVALGKSAHTLLFTQRNMAGGVNGRGICAGAVEEGRLIESKIGVTAPAFSMEIDPTDAELIGRTIHEISHGYLLTEDHCETGKDCIMQPSPTLPQYQRLLGSGEPFCDPCAEELEIGGFSALAHEL